MKIDPSEAFVADMDVVNAMIPYFGGADAGLDRYRGAITRYWDSVIPLAAFRKHYRQVATGDGTHWLAAKTAPKALPRSYVSPEVLVTSPVVDRRHVRIVRHERNQDAYDDHDHGYDEGY
jgi:hypothetical protein